MRWNANLIAAGMQIITEKHPAFILVCILLAVLLAGFLYFRDKRNAALNPWILRGLSLFRFLAVFILMLFVLNPLLRQTLNETEKAIIVIATDNSNSMVLQKDSGFVRKNLSTELEKLKEGLTEKFDVRQIYFGESARTEIKSSFTDKETDFNSLYALIENNFSGRNLGAVIIVSDGIYNKGTNPNFLYSKSQYPVYTIALGDTTPVRDASVQKVTHNQIAYLGNKFQAEITLKANGLQGKKTNLKVYRENKLLQTIPVTFKSDEEFQNTTLIFEADKPGMIKYTVQLELTEGEKIKENNYQNFFVEVIDNREKILVLYQSPHPDLAAIKESIESNQNYEVEMNSIDQFNSSSKPYSLVIFHNLTSKTPSASKIFSEMNASNLPFLLIAPGSYDNLPGLTIKTTNFRNSEAEAIVDDGFTLFTVSEDLKKFIQKFPALKVPLGNYTLANNATAFINQKIGSVTTENPIFWFSSLNEQKSGCILSDGIWKWKLRDFAEHENHNLFNELISKSVQYLSVKADKSFFRIYSKKLFNENEAIEFDAEVYNTSYQLINDPEIAMQITNSDGKVFPYQFSKSGTSYHLNAGQLPPGDYTYAANVNANGQILKKSGTFSVRELFAEKLNTVADHQTLFSLASNTGGKMYYPSQIKELEEQLLNSDRIKSVIYSTSKTSDFINLRWIFFIILCLLGTEWFLRKRNGLY